MINEEEIKRRFKNLISTTQLLKKIAQYGYEGNYTEQALYQLFDKYGIKAKTTRGGKSYFNKKNACTCIERHIFELRELAQDLERAKDWVNQNKQEPSQAVQRNKRKPMRRDVGYDRDDMSVVSRELLANDGVFGADENELYSDDDIDENTFSFKNIVNELLRKNKNAK